MERQRWEAREERLVRQLQRLESSAGIAPAAQLVETARSGEPDVDRVVDLRTAQGVNALSSAVADGGVGVWTPSERRPATTDADSLAALPEFTSESPGVDGDIEEPAKEDNSTVAQRLVRAQVSGSEATAFTLFVAEAVNQLVEGRVLGKADPAVPRHPEISAVMEPQLLAKDGESRDLAAGRTPPTRRRPPRWQSQKKRRQRGRSYVWEDG